MLATKLCELFNNEFESIKKQFKVGRQFWMYNEKKRKYVLITITYIRSGIVFFKEESDDCEKSFGDTSVVASLLYPRVIYADEVVEHINVVSRCQTITTCDEIRQLYKTIKMDIPDDYVVIDIK